jgi:hypothetical protein
MMRSTDATRDGSVSSTRALEGKVRGGEDALDALGESVARARGAPASSDSGEGSGGAIVWMAVEARDALMQRIAFLEARNEILNTKLAAKERQLEEVRKATSESREEETVEAAAGASHADQSLGSKHVCGRVSPPPVSICMSRSAAKMFNRDDGNIASSTTTPKTPAVAKCSDVVDARTSVGALESAFAAKMEISPSNPFDFANQDDEGNWSGAEDSDEENCSPTSSLLTAFNRGDNADAASRALLTPSPVHKPICAPPGAPLRHQNHIRGLSSSKSSEHFEILEVRSVAPRVLFSADVTADADADV